jgi:predicted transcriptional regulator
MVNWKNFNQPIKLTNKMLTELGVFRDAKARALSQLERVGLIKVERLGKRQAPTITLLK